MPTKADPIEVIHVMTSIEVGGAEHLVLRLLPLLPRDRFATRVLCLRRTGALEPLFRQAGIEVAVLPDAAQVGAAGLVYRLAQALRRRMPAILHTHDTAPFLIGGAARWLAGVPHHLHTKHGATVPGSRMARAAKRWATTTVDRVVAVSEETRRDAIEVEGAPQDKVIVIRNGIDASRYQFAARELPPGGARAIAVGRLEAVKGHLHLIEAMPQIVAAVPGFHLTIVGDGSQRDRLEQLASALGVSASVEFTGMRDDVAQLLSNATIFVLPSLSEGISLTLLEAMAARLAVVATSVGGTPEVVENERSALLVPPGDPIALAAALVRLARSPQLATSLAAAAHERVLSSFSLDAMADAYLALYESVAGRQQP